MSGRKNTWRTKTVSEYYKLGLDQAALEFVDVDVVADTRLFVDPRALRLLAEEDAWAEDCAELLRDYFSAVLQAVKAEDQAEGMRLLKGLREPNDTRLGMSEFQARGRGVGKGIARDIWESLSESEAAKTGLLEDLEDTALMIERVATDRISDITTNVIRGPLIGFTQDMCAKYGIKTEQVKTGLIWNAETSDWDTDESEELPVPEGRPLVLVPKSILRIKLDFDPGDYYKYVIEWLQEWELHAPNGQLVELLRNGRRRVTKKSVAAKYRRKYGNTKKQVSAGATLDNPEILDNFRKDKRSPVRRSPPPTYKEIGERTQKKPPNLTALLTAVTKVKSGKAGANAYHKAVAELFDVLFYPELIFGEVESESHNKTKRIDIRYVNSGGSGGFFAWFASNYGNAPHVVVECKNYTGDPENPELDQLLGRFTKHNGKIGILACRTFKDKAKFIERCHQAAVNDQGHILPLDDGDLKALVAARKAGDDEAFRKILNDRFHEII
jgi:hypothetical protein